MENRHADGRSWQDSDSLYHWLRNPHHMSRAQNAHFAALRESTLKTARA
ncbi:MAG: hypothetical protein ACRESR_03345 [Gammaproteobacteria bacterium]